MGFFYSDDLDGDFFGAGWGTKICIVLFGGVGGLLGFDWAGYGGAIVCGIIGIILAYMLPAILILVAVIVGLVVIYNLWNVH